MVISAISINDTSTPNAVAFKIINVSRKGK